MGIEKLDCGRLQVVRLPELNDPSPFPGLPRFLRRVRSWLAIAFENSDVVASPGQHHRRREPDNTSAQYKDFYHFNTSVAGLDEDDRSLCVHWRNTRFAGLFLNGGDNLN